MEVTEAKVGEGVQPHRLSKPLPTEPSPPCRGSALGSPGLRGGFSVFPLLKQRASRGVLDCSFLAGLSEGRGQWRPCLWLTLREVDSQPVREILKWPLALRPESWAVVALPGPAPCPRGPQGRSEETSSALEIQPHERPQERKRERKEREIGQTRGLVC